MRWLQADGWHDRGLGRRLFIVTAVVLATVWAHSYPAAAGSPARADSTVGQSLAPSADSSAVVRPQVMSYDLGDVTIVQQAYGPGSSFHDMPIRLQGILAIPAGKGPFPVALIVHGSYPFCTAPLVDGEVDAYPCPPEEDLRQYEGFGELAEALAARGYLTLVPDLSAEYNNGFGAASFGERAIGIIDAHLDALADGSGFPVDVARLGDLDLLVLAGHSRGGPLAVRYSTDPTATRMPQALALLAPAFLAPEAVIPPGLPTALVIAECDEDVGTEQPLLYLERQLPSERPSPTVVYTLPGGTHHAFSTRLAATRSPVCTDGQLMPPGQQRDLMDFFLPAFFDLALGNADAWGHPSGRAGSDSERPVSQRSAFCCWSPAP